MLQATARGRDSSDGRFTRLVPLGRGGRELRNPGRRNGFRRVFCGDRAVCTASRFLQKHSGLREMSLTAGIEMARLPALSSWWRVSSASRVNREKGGGSVEERGGMQWDRYLRHPSRFVPRSHLRI